MSRFDFDSLGWEAPLPKTGDHDGLQLSEITRELLDIVAGKVQPTLTTEAIISTSPTYTLVANAFIGEHGILLPRSIERALRIGVPGRGWAQIARAITDRTVASDLRAQLGGSANAAAVNWVLHSHSVSYYPIRAWDLLPAHLTFSAYDVGHRVVITRGELMGATGMITALADTVPSGPGACLVRLKNGNPVVLNTALGVLRDDDPATLVPLAILHPPGTRVWVRVRQRAGLPMTWVHAQALAVRAGRLDVLMRDGTVGVCESREDVKDGEAPKPPDGPVSPTSRGANPAPRMRPRAGGTRVRNVPPASG